MSYSNYPVVSYFAGWPGAGDDIKHVTIADLYTKISYSNGAFPSINIPLVEKAADFKIDSIDLMSLAHRVALLLLASSDREFNDNVPLVTINHNLVVRQTNDIGNGFVINCSPFSNGLTVELLNVWMLLLCKHESITVFDSALVPHVSSAVAVPTEFYIANAPQGFAAVVAAGAGFIINNQAFRTTARELVRSLIPKILEYTSMSLETFLVSLGLAFSSIMKIPIVTVGGGGSFDNFISGLPNSGDESLCRRFLNILIFQVTSTRVFDVPLLKVSLGSSIVTIQKFMIMNSISRFSNSLIKESSDVYSKFCYLAVINSIQRFNGIVMINGGYIPHVVPKLSIKALLEKKYISIDIISNDVVFGFGNDWAMNMVLFDFISAIGGVNGILFLNGIAVRNQYTARALRIISNGDSGRLNPTFSTRIVNPFRAQFLFMTSVRVTYSIAFVMWMQCVSSVKARSVNSAHFGLTSIGGAFTDALMQLYNEVETKYQSTVLTPVSLFGATVSESSLF